VTGQGQAFSSCEGRGVRRGRDLLSTVTGKEVCGRERGVATREAV